jgi:hypothetical protein
MSVYAGPEIVSDSSLVLSLDAANIKSYPGSGTTWTDISGNGNNATLTDAPTFSTNNKGYFNFNGSTNLVSLGASNIFNFGTGNFTIEAWFWLDSTASPNRGDNLKTVTIFDCGASVSNATAFSIGGSSSSVGTNVEYYQTTPSYAANLSYNISANKWHHIIWQRNSTSINGFVDGVSLTPAVISAGTTLGGNNTAYIGQSKITSYKNQFKGYISVIRLYNRAITTAEIQQNFNAHRGRYGI